MAARLVIDRPALAVAGAEMPIEDICANALRRAHAQAVFSARLGMRAQRPRPALVGEGVLEGGAHQLGGRIRIVTAHAAPLQLAAENAGERVDALRVPAAQLVLRHALEPAVHNRADVPRCFAGPGELDTVFVTAFGRRAPADGLRLLGCS